MDAQPRARPPAVAGHFYPEDPAELRRSIAICFEDSRPRPAGPPAKALIVPHAGYVYSGPVAASAYHELPARGPTVLAVLIGPSHFVPFGGLAVSAADVFDTPLGSVPVDGAARERALQIPGCRVLEDAHVREHSLEVQLPFLQCAELDLSILPILVGDADPETVSRAIQGLWWDPGTVLIVSSDLSHYHSYPSAQRIDAVTCDAIERLEPGKLDGGRACGWRAVEGLIIAARREGLDARCLDRRNSGDTAGGRRSVVGYAAFAFTEPQRPV